MLNEREQKSRASLSKGLFFTVTMLVFILAMIFFVFGPGFLELIVSEGERVRFEAVKALEDAQLLGPDAEVDVKRYRGGDLTETEQGREVQGWLEVTESDGETFILKVEALMSEGQILIEQITREDTGTVVYPKE